MSSEIPGDQVPRKKGCRTPLLARDRPALGTRRPGGDPVFGVRQLSRLHQWSKGLHPRSAFLVPVSCRDAVPHIGRYIVEGHALPLFIEIGKVGLRYGVALHGAATSPVDSLLAVDGHSHPFVVKNSKAVLRLGNALLGGSEKPARRFLIVAGYASTDEIHAGQ